MKRLYIYMKADYLISTLEKDEIKVVLPDSCNDPFEFLPEEVEGKEPHDTSGVGIICFSGNGTSSTMWAHYADKHKGVCLEFELPCADPKENLEIKNGPDSSDITQAVMLDIEEKELREQYNITDKDGACLNAPVLMKVKYSPYRSHLSSRMVYKNKSGKWRQLPYSRFFAAKGQEWSYEKEWRLLVSLDNCLSYHDGCYYVKGLTQYISKVMLGWKCKSIRKDFVQKKLDSLKLKYSPRCVKMEPEKNRFALRDSSDKDAETTPLWLLNLEFSDEQWKALAAFFEEKELTTCLRQGGIHRAVYEFLKTQCQLPEHNDNLSEH